jgi:hypothetical protein
MTPEAPWADLVTLAERELELALEGRWEEAMEASTVRLETSLALGAPPAAARGHLERLLELQQLITAGLTVARANTARQLGDMTRGRTAMRGYGSALGTAQRADFGRA